jgi:ParB family transcriptional regulator, chromosome partitioning protein
VSNQIKEISIGDFDLSLGQMRIMNMSRIVELEKSMRLHGQLQPVVGRLHEGGIQLIDGYKRLYAAEALLMESLQCRLLEVDEHQAKVLMLSYNWTSRSLESYEEALVLKNLQDNHAMDQRELSRVTGKSASWVSRRLGLIERLDKEIGTEIRMGVLTGSHARALIRLPRGNQLPIARVIQTHKLTTRQSDHLVDAYLSAQDEKSQQLLLKAPERALYKRNVHEPQTDMYDPRLNGFGNEVARSMQEVITSIQDLLKLLEDHRSGSLQQTERMLLSPGLKLITDGLDTLKKAIDEL